MRKSMNLVLAAGLAASAFASTAAAQKAGCASENPVLDTTKGGFEETISGQSAAFMYTGFRTVNRFAIDTTAKRQDVTFGVSYSGAGQYNMRIHDTASGDEIARIEPTGGVGEMKVKVADCQEVMVYVYAEQVNGGPTSPMVNVTFTGTE